MCTTCFCCFSFLVPLDWSFSMHRIAQIQGQTTPEFHHEEMLLQKSSNAKHSVWNGVWESRWLEQNLVWVDWCCLGACFKDEFHIVLSTVLMLWERLKKNCLILWVCQLGETFQKRQIKLRRNERFRLGMSSCLKTHRSQEYDVAMSWKERSFRWCLWCLVPLWKWIWFLLYYVFDTSLHRIWFHS